jgi:hypothetical protein
MRHMPCKAMLRALCGMGALLMLLPMLAHACAVCAGGAEDDGYFWGVLFLMSMPFAVGGFIGGWLLYSYRRAQAGFATAAATPTVDQDKLRASSTMWASDGGDEASPANRA